MTKPNITDHPTTRLLKKIEEQDRVIKMLRLDIAVLRDLLIRTVHMLTRAEMDNPKKKGPFLFK